ncbi:putative sulfate exporter family transporter [Sphingosinicellaceae bacterium]|nr:putative sulfate exporter family transporter [Sphingosinicellaceae bacterium]
MGAVSKSRPPTAADLYGDVGPELGWRSYVPGLAVTAAAALAAGYLADHYRAPLTLMALLIGLALNFLNADARLAPGLAFASRTLLRVGIVLVGFQVTFGQMIDLGPGALVAIVVIVALTMAVALVTARALGFSAAFGTLAGGAVAICGASAAMALATLLGERRISQAQLALVLVVVSALSSLAMFFYPIIAAQFGLSDVAAGFLIGASIHDVAQALGAGYAYSHLAGQTAAIVKLTRVALLAPVLAIVAMAFPSERRKGLAGLAPPWFVLGFFAVAALNSTIDFPAAVGTVTRSGTAGLLACAVAATGIRSPMKSLLGTSMRPMVVLLVATLAALALGSAVAKLVID